MTLSLSLKENKEQIIGERALPENYLGLSDDEMDARISTAKRALGKRLLILGHHYQRDEVIKFADHKGDSFKLARKAAEQKEAEWSLNQ